MELLSTRSGETIGRRSRGSVHPYQRRGGRRDLGHSRGSRNRRAPAVLVAIMSDSPRPQPRTALAHPLESLAMAKLVFAFLPDGLAVDVLIGLDGATLTAQVASGQALTHPIFTRGEIDTGSNITAVSTAILQRLGVSA